jgi:hypothetical protein
MRACFVSFNVSVEPSANQKRVADELGRTVFVFSLPVTVECGFNSRVYPQPRHAPPVRDAIKQPPTFEGRFLRLTVSSSRASEAFTLLVPR